MADELPAVARRRMDIVIAAQRPGEVVERLVHGVAGQGLPMADFRPVGHAAHGQADGRAGAARGDRDDSEIAVAQMEFPERKAFVFPCPGQARPDRQFIRLFRRRQYPLLKFAG